MQLLARTGLTDCDPSCRIFLLLMQPPINRVFLGSQRAGCVFGKRGSGRPPQPRHQLYPFTWKLQFPTSHKLNLMMKTSTPSIRNVDSSNGRRAVG
ncbi:hypothetical protein MLD38_028460 [Melastoma candidum]|uniref:Uncharacterized protein n=1 Tax=Melastoma candidum TaxID=119954 RepID=A0ACB9N160_9MYRT|nr:hypothetical protein MLD38_028460 [Melastoma candidum]